MLGRLDLLRIVNLRRMMFVKRMMCSEYKFISDLMQIYSQQPELISFQTRPKIKHGYADAKIKA